MRPRLAVGGACCMPSSPPCLETAAATSRRAARPGPARPVRQTTTTAPRRGLLHVTDLLRCCEPHRTDRTAPLHSQGRQAGRRRAGRRARRGAAPAKWPWCQPARRPAHATQVAARAAAPQRRCGCLGWLGLVFLGESQQFSQRCPDCARSSVSAGQASGRPGATRLPSRWMATGQHSSPQGLRRRMQQQTATAQARTRSRRAGQRTSPAAATSTHPAHQAGRAAARPQSGARSQPTPRTCSQGTRRPDRL
jgi:hypothetical protein